MNDKIKILLAEDEPNLGLIVKESLETRNFQVILCKDGDETLKLYHTEKPKLLVLDVMMPCKDGFTVAKEIREENKDIPIIFLTSKSQTNDVIEGFNSGGNDYIKKPFSMEELIVRIKALLDRYELKRDKEKIQIGNYIFNFPKQTLELEGKCQQLTHREAQLLYYLTQRRNEVLDRTFILNKLWGDSDFFTTRSMDVFISKLRKKLQDDESIQILNVRGYGYKLVY